MKCYVRPRDPSSHTDSPSMPQNSIMPLDAVRAPRRSPDGVERLASEDAERHAHDHDRLEETHASDRAVLAVREQRGDAVAAPRAA
jgi:hypothetical protein